MEVKEFETEVIDVIRRAPDVKSFRFSIPEDIEISFKPGQFFVVTIKIEGTDAYKHFSFSNSPGEKGYIEFTKRITGSRFSQALDNLKKGDWAKLKLPFGFFTFEGEHEKVAFLTGGIGITCIRSMMKMAAASESLTDMVLIFSNRTEEDIIFRNDLSEMEEQNRSIKVVHTLTSDGIDKNIWHGRVGRINSPMIKEEISDFMDRVFYVCGPPKMVESLRAMLADELAVEKEKIKFEHFTGY